MVEYVALIHCDEGSDFGVSFPDFPGCVTAGVTLEEARSMAAEALALHVEGMIEDGEAIPVPSPFAQIMEERENRDAVAVLVSLPARTPRTVRVNITLAEDVLTEIDAYAEQHGLTRSGFIVKAAKRVMAANAAALDPSLLYRQWHEFLPHPTCHSEDINEMWRLASRPSEMPWRGQNMRSSYVFEIKNSHIRTTGVLRHLKDSLTSSEPPKTAKSQSTSSVE
jgi:predicted RNase H-like HicB family nuclease